MQARVFTSQELERLNEECLSSKQRNNMDALLRDVDAYQAQLREEVQRHFANNPNEQAVSREVIGGYVREFAQHNGRLLGYEGQLVTRGKLSKDQCSQRKKAREEYYEDCKRKSGLGERIPDDEVIVTQQREEALQEQGGEAAHTRKGWYLFLSTVTVQAVGAIVLGSASDMAAIGLKLVAETAGTAVLNTTAATVDDACRGDVSLASSGEALRDGALAGVAMGAVSTVVQASASAISQTTTNNGSSSNKDNGHVLVTAVMPKTPAQTLVAVATPVVAVPSLVAAKEHEVGLEEKGTRLSAARRLQQARASFGSRLHMYQQADVPSGDTASLPGRKVP